MATANDDEVLARFIQVYATPERGQKLWEQWMSVQSPVGQGILEQLAEAASEEHGTSIEEARGRLAVEKLVQDRGIDYAEKYLTKRDAAEWKASRPLKPMTPGVKKTR